MSTSIKGLKSYEIMFLRPAKFISFVGALLAIVLSPRYNVVIVGGGFVVYQIMFQLRGYIYRLGLSRFYFLGSIFFLSLLLSVTVEFNLRTTELGTVMGSFDLWSFIKSEGYQSQVLHVLWYNLDGLIHWKLLVFAPAAAVLFYIVNVELDRKKVRDTDIHDLHINDEELFRFYSWAFYLFYGLALVVAWTYSPLCCGLLLCIAMLLAILDGLYILPSIIVITAIFMLFLVMAVARFEYDVFLALPRHFFSLWSSYGFIETSKWAHNYQRSHEIGQMGILSCGLLFPLLLQFNLLRNKNVALEVKTAKATQESVDRDIEALIFAKNLTTNKHENLTHKELNMHMFINGATGSGKTVAFMNFVIDACAKQLPLIYIDGKGSPDLEGIMRMIANHYKRTFRVFSLNPYAINNVMRYDFLGSGNYTERKNRIMNLFILADEAGAAYYQDRVERLVNNVFRVIDHHKLSVDLYRFLKLINNINDLIEMSSSVDGELREYFLWVKEEKKDNPRIRILEKLDVFVNSVYGYLFDVIDQSDVINLQQSIKNNEIVLFLLDASAYALDTPKVAKMVISDLNSTFSELGLQRQKLKAYCCFDEFKSYETEAIATSIALHRSNGMMAIIGTQSISVIKREIAEAILANCNTYLVLASSSNKDTETFANLYGTYKKYDVATHIKTEMQEVTGITNRRVEDYIVSPQDIKNIVTGSGMGYLYRKAAGRKPVKVKVYKKY